MIYHKKTVTICIIIFILSNILFCSGKCESVKSLLLEEYIFSTKWGCKGSNNGQFESITGITVDLESNVYIVDWSLNHIQKFTSNGDFITKWGSEGNEDGQFYRPGSITIDLNNNIYVVQGYIIQKFDLNGNFVIKWIMKDHKNQVIDVEHIALDSKNNIFVTCHNRIVKFDSNGAYMTEYDNHIPTNGIVINSKNDIYVLCNSSELGWGKIYIHTTYIYKYDCKGNFIGKLGSRGTKNGQFKDKCSIAIDYYDNIFIADSWNNRIQKFDSNGNFITKWGKEGKEEGQFNMPGELTVDLMGNVYVVDTFNYRIQKFSPKP